MARDGQPQPRAAKTPRGAAIGLRKGIKDNFLFVGRDTHACVAHLEAHIVQALRRDRQPHMAVFGEFDRVAHQIGQHLTQTARIAEHELRQHALHIPMQREVLGACRLGVKIMHLPDHRRQIEHHALHV